MKKKNLKSHSRIVQEECNLSGLRDKVTDVIDNRWLSAQEAHMNAISVKDLTGK